MRCFITPTVLPDVQMTGNKDQMTGNKDLASDSTVGMDATPVTSLQGLSATYVSSRSYREIERPLSQGLI